MVSPISDDARIEVVSPEPDNADSQHEQDRGQHGPVLSVVTIVQTIVMAAKLYRRQHGYRV